MKFADLGLKTKFMTGSILPLLICVFLGVTGVMTLRLLGSTIQTMDRLGSMDRLASDLERGVDRMENGLRRYLLTGDKKFLERYNKAGTRVSIALTDLKKSVTGKPKEMKALRSAEEVIESWKNTFSEPAIESRKTVRDAKTVSEIASKEDSGKHLDSFRQVIATFQKDVEGRKQNNLEYGLYYQQLMEDLVIYGLTISVLLALILSYAIAHKVTKPLLRAVYLAEAISNGDLTRNLEVRGSDEVGRLGTSLNSMVENLRVQAQNMVEVVSTLSSSTAEISTTLTQLAQNTANTSAAVEETTTTVEQVKQAAILAKEKAHTVAETSQEAVQTSTGGRKATEDTVQRMNLIKEQMESIGETVVRLSEHSRAIEEIIATVQDLAEQSNLLAVNASIEAARAGEHGKGFSVVANEIKALADQSREATEQVRSILEDTNTWVSAVVMATEEGGKAVDSGVQQSLSAGTSIQTLGQIVEASAQAASVIQVATEQQTAGVHQVAKAMENIELAVKQNESGTTEIERAVRGLRDLGSQLHDLASRYQL